VIIDYLTVCDFRVFSGTHKFDLAPRTKYGRQRPIILFGGLNGAGKTSVLTALKLALYGKGVLGAVSASEYHDYLRNSVHKAPLQTIKANYSVVELGFTYAQLGVLSHYVVKRDWSIDPNGKVKEGLHIYCDGNALDELSYEQAQSFLNELIPIGVSELFFFDGEKIKALAEETTGEALRDSIEKLLGLDIISRLDSDLSVLVRTRAAKSTTTERQRKIATLESEYRNIHADIQRRLEELQSARITTEQIALNVQQLQKQIDARGGAWSTTQQSESTKLSELVNCKATLEDQLREVAGALLPLSIVGKQAASALEVLRCEQDDREKASLASLLRRRRKSFESAIEDLRVSRKALDVYDKVFSDVINKNRQKPLHDLSDTQIASIQHRLESVLPIEVKKARSLARELEKLEEGIDLVGLNIARAPDEEVLRPLYIELSDETQKLGAAKAKHTHIADALKGLSARLSEIARQLDSLYAEISSSQDKDRIYSSAARARELLREFSLRTSERKIKELELRFVESFSRLARKQDIDLSIKIDSANYDVVLLDRAGNCVNKNELSAGEKQIYAIAILEALARTSGRSLPVIIDTPLGRLDSHHRRNLVEHYFPNASHQVLILSTDTEIDNAFYQALSPNISHGYHLEFDSKSRSTSEEEGYFWKSEATV
jgi:DNA sulfur modification protein DndD